MEGEAQQGFGVAASRWLGDGKAKAKERGMWLGAIACHHRHVFVEFTYVFRLSVSIRKVASENPFCILTYMSCYIIYLFYFIYLIVKNISHIKMKMKKPKWRSTRSG